MFITIAHSLFRKQNSALNMATIGGSGYLANEFAGNIMWAPLIYLSALLMYDIAYYAFATPIINPHETLAHGYNFSLLMDDDGSANGHGLDYGFNYYNGDFKKTRRRAQLDKYEHAYELLGLKPGMKVVDCGCGCGDWLLWLKEQGIDAIGINITDGQANHCRSKGLKVICSDWKKIRGSKYESMLTGQYDVVTFWDTVEHYVPAQHRKNETMQDKIYDDMFKMAKSFLSPDSNVRKIWISCLHGVYQLMKNSIPQKMNNYLLDKFHSGYYPAYQGRQLERIAKQNNIHKLTEENLTEDYYMTSVLEPSHFGKHKFSLSANKIATLMVNAIFDPNWIQRLVWFSAETWMYQFNPDDLSKSPMQMLWLSFDVR
jgi:cyclopropane fatty-acyl-phospholipid synthase-like methyltransferase